VEVVQNTMSQGGSYVFSQQPRPVNRQKYRSKNSNIMADRRVVRGNTYASRPLLPQEQPQTRLQNTRFANTRLYDQNKRGGRKQEVHVEEVQEVNVLEELTDIPINEDFSTQTDAMEVEDNANVEFVPKVRGQDQATFIEELEMFDFESSALPILEVLIGKAMDQGLMEVRQEEEVKVLNTQRQGWEHHCNIIHTEAQRLLMEAQRHKEEKDRRLAQAHEARLQAQIEEHHHCARTMAKDFFQTLQETALSRLAQAGHFYDPVRTQVENTFLPWTMDKVMKQLAMASLAQEDVDRLLKNTITRGYAEVEEATRAREALRERLRKEEEERVRAEEEERVRLEEEAERRKAERDAAGEGDEEDEDDDE